MKCRFTFAGALIALSAVALGAVADGQGASAQALVSGGESFIDVKLLPGRAEADGGRMAALVIDVTPEWKTYWRNPGEAGIPPRFDWTRSENLRGAEILWPRPHAFESFGITTLGYSGRVVFPVRLEPENPAQPMQIDLGLSLGVCKDICILEETRIQGRIMPGEAETGADLVAAAEATVPMSGGQSGLTRATCRISGSGASRQFDAKLEFDRTVEAPMVIVEGPETTWFSQIVTTAGAPGATGGSRIMVAAAMSLIDGSAWVDRSELRLTVLGEDFAADVRGCAAPG